MLQRYKSIALFIAVLALGGCSSKKSDDIEPQATSTSLPKTLRIDSYNTENPTYLTFVWKDQLLTSYTETTRNTTTNKDIVSTCEYIRNNKNLIISEKYTYKDANNADVSRTFEYFYNTDSTEISSTGFSHKLIYNNKGQVIKIVYGREGSPDYHLYSYVYDSNGQLTTLFNGGLPTGYANPLTDFTTVENPLYKLAEKTQFLAILPFSLEIILHYSKMIPKSFDVFSAQYPYYITYSLDDQQRVSSMTVTYKGNIVNKFTLGY